MNALISWLFRIAGIPLWGFVYQSTWNWFGPVVFPTPEMAPWTLKQGVAAMVLVGLVKARYSRAEYDVAVDVAKTDAADAHETQLKYVITTSFVFPVVLLGLGWLIHFVVRP